MEKLVYIDETKVKELLDWDETLNAVTAAMESVSTKNTFQEARTFTNVLDTKNILLTMPGYVRNNLYGGLACKLVTSFPMNTSLEKPLPTILANISLFDENTGKLKAVIAATEITKWRTAAASAVATKYIYNSKSQKKYDVLAILGAGEQGKIHAVAFYHFCKFKEIRIWNRSPRRAETLVDDLNNNVAAGVFKVGNSQEECVANADVIVTATYATEPILKLDWIKEDVHVNAVGAGVNHHTELEEAIYLKANVFIDYWSGAKRELAGLETLGIQFKGEVGDLISGNVPLTSVDGITVFQNLGMAAEDCVMARIIYDRFCGE